MEDSLPGRWPDISSPRIPVSHLHILQGGSGPFEKSRLPEPIDERTSAPLVPDGGNHNLADDPVPELHDYLLPAEVDSVLDALSDGVLLLDAEYDILAVNKAVVKDTGFRELDLIGEEVETVIDVGYGEGFEKLFEPADETDQSTTIQDGIVRTVGDDEISAVITVASRRLTARRSGTVITYRLLSPNESRWQQNQRERLALVNQFNTTLRKVTRSVIESTNRENLEVTVCEELARAAPYEFSIIAQHSPASKKFVVPRAWAGIGDDAVADLLSPIEPGEDEDCPIAQAIATGEVQIETGIDKNPVIRRCTKAKDLPKVSSVAVIPIRFEQNVYGVLAVYSKRVDHFEDYEVRMLEELGAIVGFVYNAVDKQELLLTDTVTEVVVELTDRDAFFVKASKETGSRIELDSVVPTVDGGLRFYHRVEGGSTERLLEMATQSPYIKDTAIIRSNGESSEVVFELTEQSLVERLFEHNINVRRAYSEGGVVTLYLEVSPSIGAETVINVIGSVYDDFEIRSIQNRERPSLSIHEFRHEVLDQLTDRQREVIVAAFRNGYFERPRVNNATEIASQIGIAPSTFHQHLRAGLLKLMRVLLESDPQTQTPWS